MKSDMWDIERQSNTYHGWLVIDHNIKNNIILGVI